MLDTHEFPTPAEYRPSYRSIIFSSCSRENDLDFYFDEDSPLNYQDLLATDDYYIRWVMDHFQHYIRVIEQPWIIVHGDYLTLKDWKPRPANLEVIRQKGLSIFMYEPIFIYGKNGQWPCPPKEEPQYLEIEKLAKFVSDHDIRTPVTVYLCERGLDRILQNDSRFERLEFKSFSSYLLKTINDCLQHATLPQRKLTKKFMCLNFRYEPIREMLVGYFTAKGYLDSSYVSFYHKHNMEEFYKYMPLTPEDIAAFPTIMEGIRRMQKYLPMSLETHNPEAVDPAVVNIPDLDGKHNITNHFWLSMDFVPQTFIFTYCESRPFSPRSEISEKTIHPIFARKPFLPFAGPFFLAGLREMGFKTFSEFWDESFDQIIDPARRFSRYLAAIDSIATMSMDEIRELNEKIQPIIEHNHNWISRYLVHHEQMKLSKSQLQANQ